MAQHQQQQQLDQKQLSDSDDAIPPLSTRQSLPSDRSLSRARSIFARRSTAVSPEELASGIRYIQLNDHLVNAERNFISNRLKTAKYTPINMLPKALFEQFRRLANFYFLVIACISFIPGISPSSPYANVAPLFIVVGFGFARDVYEDIQRSIEDTKQNNERQIIMARAPENVAPVSKSLSAVPSDIKEYFNANNLDPDLHRTTASKNISVGDIVFVKKNQVFPCDLLLLYSSGEDGVSYVSTANLDGESNLKRTIVSAPTSEINNPSQLRSLIGNIRAQKPTPALHEFEASMTLNNGEAAPLDTSNLMLRGSILRNTDYIYGLAVYTGFDSKVALNMRHPPSKMGTIEKKLNAVVLFLFFCLSLLVFGFSIAAAILQRNQGSAQWYMGVNKDITSGLVFARSLGTFLILFSTFIPVSLFVTLEFIRLLQALFMAADIRMRTKGQSVVARATNLNEMLGDVDHILSDKTGTLTENIMRYIACSADGTIYNILKDKNTMQNAINDGIKPVRELVLAMSLCHSVVPEPKEVDPNADNDSNSSNSKKKTKKFRKKNKTKNYKESSRAAKSAVHVDGNELDIEIRHEGALDSEIGDDVNVSDDTDDSIISDDLPEYQGQSPDEVALVTSAREYGVSLLKRTLDSMVIDHFGTKETYETLAELEFNSDRKRMSMIVKTPDNKIHMYTKGADTILLPLLEPSTDLGTIQEHIDEFAKEGLRTLVYAQKVLDQKVFDEWFERFQDARNSLENRDEKVSMISEEIEKSLDFIATTAVEDKLQDMVPETIKFMREAGIKLWVLTGDKRETAENIGYSANLLDRDMDVVHIEGNTSDEIAGQLENTLNRHTKTDTEHGHYGVDFNDGGMNTDQLSPRTSIANMARRVSNMVGLSPRSVKKEKELGIIIDGKSLSFALDDHAQIFMSLSDHCKVVICARVTPLQKALVVRLVKKARNALTLAIGDGGNDVSMIQEAHIGIGIFGKEGSQAARSADYAMGEFKHLLRLLALHGRYSGIRTSGMINLSFYKNIFFAMTQVFFQIFDFSSGVTYNNQWLTSAFNVIVTSASPFLFGIFERDLKESTVLRFPSVYSTNRDHKSFSLLTVIEYTLVYGLWHGFITFFGLYLTFGFLKIGFISGLDSGLVLTGFANSTLVVLMTLFKIVLHSSTLNWIVLLAILLSLAIYIAVLPMAIYIVSEYRLEGQLSMLFTSTTFYIAAFVIFVAAFFIDFGVMLVRRLFFPNVVDRLQQWERDARQEKRKSK